MAKLGQRSYDRSGMNKDQLYNLIGRPHFSEGLYGVEEWDYAFNYRENGVHKNLSIQNII